MVNMFIQAALWPLGFVIILFFACSAWNPLRRFLNEIVKGDPEAVTSSHFFIGGLAGSATLAILLAIGG